MDKKYSNVLTVVLVIAIIAVIGILIFLGIKLVREPIKVHEDADNVINEFNENTPDVPKDEEKKEETESDINIDEIFNNLGNDDTNSIYDANVNNQSSDVYLKGYKVIGTISIPSIDVNYPILEENSTEAEKLAITLMYPSSQGNALNKVGNVVLSGHNYKNGTFFSDINKLSTGSKIYIKDRSGEKVQYSVYNMYETSDSDMKFATRDTEGRREITLYTCAISAGRRTIVCASEITK